MKHFKYKIIAVVAFAILNSCGTSHPKPNSPCPDEDIAGNMYSGFTARELDTIVIKRYKKDTEFKTFIDEHTEYPKNIIQKKNESYISIEYSQPLNTAYDYLLIANGYHFYIKNLKVDWDIRSTMNDERYSCEIVSCVINDSLDVHGDCLLDKYFGRRK